MPVQMLMGGVEIQMRLSGSDAVADVPYSFSSRFAFVITFSPGAIACAGPVIVHASLKNSGGGVFAAPRPRPSPRPAGACADNDARLRTATTPHANLFIAAPSRSPSVKMTRARRDHA